MRTFLTISFAFLAFYMTGCVPDSKDCNGAVTKDCSDDDSPDAGTAPENCGDNACKADDGETADNCPEDCKPESCGDGVCDAAQQETSTNCHEDCNTECLSEDFPVFCEDDQKCWPSGTDCSLPTYSCNGQDTRCPDEFSAANCCDDGGGFCPDYIPYWCPDQQTCTETAEECPTNCSYRAMSCTTGP